MRTSSVRKAVSSMSSINRRSTRFARGLISEEAELGGVRKIELASEMKILEMIVRPS